MKVHLSFAHPKDLTRYFVKDHFVYYIGVMPKNHLTYADSNTDFNFGRKWAYLRYSTQNGL